MSISEKLKKPARILTIDIENSPNLAWVWGLWDQNIALSQLVEESTVLCFAAKWSDESEVQYYSLEKDGHKKMIRKAWQLLDEADIVIGYNSKRFDITHLNREFFLMGLGAPSPFQQIDLLQVSRQNFKFVSQKLEYVAERAGVGQKYKNSGFELWLRCMLGTTMPGTKVDKDAWIEMEKYNRQDVVVTELLYLEFRGWIKGGPNLATFMQAEDACPNCASTNLVKRGTRTVGISVYQQYQCKDCKAWSKSAKAIKGSVKPNVRS